MQGCIASRHDHIMAVKGAGMADGFGLSRIKLGHDLPPPTKSAHRKAAANNLAVARKVRETLAELKALGLRTYLLPINPGTFPDGVPIDYASTLM